MTGDRKLSRRQTLRYGSASLLGVTALAGCTGDGGDGSGGGSSDGSSDSGSSGGDAREITWGGTLSRDNPDHLFDTGLGLYGHDHFLQQWEERSDEIPLNMNFVGESGLCGEAGCVQRIQSGTLDIGTSSVGNTTEQWPWNDVFLIPYTFPSNASFTHTVFHEDTWEEYWVPFMQETGAVPFIFATPFWREVLIGTDAFEEDNPVTSPSDIEGMSIRRTMSQVSGIAIENWGANPEALSWGDTLEGLRTGVVDGMETYTGTAFAFGMGDSLGEVVMNRWTMGVTGHWATLDFLQSLDDETVEILAEMSKTTTEAVTHEHDRVVENRVGLTDSPPEGSAASEFGVRMNVPTESEMEEWRSAVSYPENPKLYEDIFSDVDRLGIDGEEFYNYLREKSRQSDTPDNVEDVTINTWWDDYINEV